MSENAEAKPSKIVACRRSSFKNSNPNGKLDPQALGKLKRNSVSWGQSNTFEFKAMKAMFQESNEVNQPKKEDAEKHQKFIESRKKSIKNEFSIVKELMKNKNFIAEEEDVDEEVKNSADKNVKYGHEALNEESESSSSSNSQSENEEDKGKEIKDVKN